MAASATVIPISAKRSERAIERRCIWMGGWRNVPVSRDRTPAADGPSAAPRRSARGYHADMSLARAWRRQLSEAWTAAVLVPGTMLAALLVLALAGGFGRIAAVGQAFAGPSVPAHAPGARSSGGAVGATASAGALQALAFAPSTFTAPARSGP